MVASFPDLDCDSSFVSCGSAAPLFPSGHHAYTSDSSSNFSCSSSSTDTSGSSTRRSSWEKSASLGRNSKPHKAHDAAWTAIRALRLREGSVGITHFKLLRRVGHGDIGSVYLSQLRGTNCIFAMKVMDKEALAHRNKVQRMHTEREILEFVDHPFLPTLYAHFDTEKFSCLVMEFCPGGDLHALRQRQSGKRFSLKAVRFYAAEVLVALEYLHMLGVVYRDLKPENVLVREDGHIMLTDFDLSLKCEVKPMLLKYPTRSSSGRRSLSRSSSQQSQRSSCMSPCSLHPIIASCMPLIGNRKQLSKQTSRTSRSSNSGEPRNSTSSNSSSSAITRGHQQQQQRQQQAEDLFPELVAEPTQARSMSFVGTHEYLAPEIIGGFGHGSAVDWWTFGIFLFELLFGRTPFKGSSNDQTLMNIIRQHLRFPEGADIEVGEAGKSLMQGLLVKDPRKRLGSSRGAAEIKQHPFFRGVNWALIRCAKPPEVPKARHQEGGRSAAAATTPASSSSSTTAARRTATTSRTTTITAAAAAASSSTTAASSSTTAASSSSSSSSSSAAARRTATTSRFTSSAAPATTARTTSTAPPTTTVAAAAAPTARTSSSSSSTTAAAARPTVARTTSTAAATPTARPPARATTSTTTAASASSSAPPLAKRASNHPSDPKPAPTQSVEPFLKPKPWTVDNIISDTLPVFEFF